MSGIVTLARVELRLLTPLFSAGADQNIPELRASSIKSALRFWYRAVDPRAVVTERKGDPRYEDRFFGGGGEGASQSPVLMRLKAERRPFEWKNVNLSRFDEGSGTHRRNGIRYLSYSLHMRPNDQRQALAPGLTMILTLQAERRRLETLGDADATRRAWIAALWLLGNLGSLGTRSRRGLGGLEITNWSTMAQDEWKEDAAALPDLRNARSPQAWHAGFTKAMEVFDRWFIPEGTAYSKLDFVHPHFGEDMRAALLGEGFRTWEEALNAAGRKLQDFRVRRAPDYRDVKRALASGRPVTQAPERAAFGLPLTFRYSSLPGRTAEFVPTRRGGKERKRHASLLFVRLVRLGELFHPLFVRMSGAVPGVNPPADMLFKEERRPDRREEKLTPARVSLLDDFMASLGGTK